MVEDRAHGRLLASKNPGMDFKERDRDRARAASSQSAPASAGAVSMGHPKRLLDLTAAAEQEGLPLQVVCPTCGKSVNPEELTIDEVDEELAIESVSTAHGSLLTSQGISRRFHIPVKIIDDLARREVMPHYRVKGIDQPLFHRVESKEWIKRNLFQRVEGGELVPPVI
jgi:hypothetical protein